MAGTKTLGSLLDLNLRPAVWAQVNAFRENSMKRGLKAADSPSLLATARWQRTLCHVFEEAVHEPVGTGSCVWLQRGGTVHEHHDVEPGGHRIRITTVAKPPGELSAGQRDGSQTLAQPPIVLGEVMRRTTKRCSLWLQFVPYAEQFSVQLPAPLGIVEATSQAADQRKHATARRRDHSFQ